MFEYSPKGLMHALQHARELVETFGHHGACCTCTAEAGHKLTIKGASRFARTYGDRNETQEGMLEYVQRQQLFTAILHLNRGVAVTEPSDDEGDDHRRTHTLREPVPSLTQGWPLIRTTGGRPPREWGATFLSRQVLITREELLVLLRTKLEMAPTWNNITLLATQLHWECFGFAVLEDDDGDRRKVVGFSKLSPARRDFVRIRGTEDETALSAQVIMFVRVSGLLDAGIDVPRNLRTPTNDTCTRNMVTFALVRWLTPDPRALIRDSKKRPLCPPPFDMNHALWNFAKTQRQRSYLTDRLFARQLHMFDGTDGESKRRHADSLKYARYDLLQLDTIESFMNCTYKDNVIMETITLPFA